MKRSVRSPALALLFTGMVLGVLLITLALGGCDEAGAGDDGTGTGDDGTGTGDDGTGTTEMDLDGTYVGSFEFTDVGGGSNDRSDTWKMVVSGNAFTLSVYAGGTTDVVTGTIELTTGEYSISWVVPAPDPHPFTWQSSGTITADGKVEGTGTLDFDSNGTIEKNSTMSGVKHTSGYIIQGQMVLAGPITEAVGRPYVVIVDEDGIGDTEDDLITYFLGIAGGHSSPQHIMSYIVTGVPEGDWEVYGVLFVSEEQYSDPSEDAHPTAGTDYSGGTDGPISITADTYDCNFNLTLHEL